MIACYRGQAAMVSLLIGAGANLRFRDTVGTLLPQKCELAWLDHPLVYCVCIVCVCVCVCVCA